MPPVDAALGVQGPESNHNMDLHSNEQTNTSNLNVLVQEWAKEETQKDVRLHAKLVRSITPQMLEINNGSIFKCNQGHIFNELLNEC